eukprot:CAMPEP_0198595726 /NCGR_PEP_ID=MMETSP1462-20131121/142252_1 /TAXON_ID=1333877 /ORGANISM="Brandtodinium nutriculum, Strain RCC3387" /LENGTH=177 /DNA_ID=CAMNT_0044327365 /DNA_START=11 /DNA_END=540 /DNA_ORIENTATION=-
MRRPPPSAALANAERLRSPHLEVVALRKSERSPTVINVIGRIVLEQEAEHAIGRFPFHDDLLKGVSLLRDVLREAVDDSSPQLVDRQFDDHVPGAVLRVLRRVRRAGRRRSLRPLDPQRHAVHLAVLQRLLRALRAVARVQREVAGDLLARVPAADDVQSGDDAVAAEQGAQGVLGG